MRGLPTLAFLFFLLLAPSFGMALTLSMSPAHYGRQMEFYYENPRPEILAGLLRSFAENRILAKGENRFLLGAFFAELAACSKIDLGKFVDLAMSLGRDARVTLAWSAHLSNAPNKKSILGQLVEPRDKLVLKQINRSPAPLSAWPGTEKSVLLMYWGAFMAAGKTRWVDSIIDCALEYAENPANPCAAYAAASLYEYAPRHNLVAGTVRKRLPQVEGEKKRILERILAAVK